MVARFMAEACPHVFKAEQGIYEPTGKQRSKLQDVAEMTTFAGDEAGHTSFNFEKGATRYFVVAFINTDEPDELRQAVTRFRQEHSLPKPYEFSFHEATGRGIRESFFVMLAEQVFNAWILVVDKAALPDLSRGLRGTDFYSFCVSELIKAIPADRKRGATLLLDEYDSAGKTLASLGRMMKARGINRGFKKIVVRRSQSEDLVQVADMVAGATLRQFAKNDDSHLRVIEERVDLLIRYG